MGHHERVHGVDRAPTAARAPRPGGFSAREPEGRRNGGLTPLRGPASGRSGETAAMLVDLDVGLMYHILRWFLPQADAIKTQAYVGFFLSDVGVPAHLAHDEDVLELRQEIKMQQRTFVDLHRAHDSIVNQARSPAAVKEQIGGMEREYEQLTSRIEKAKMKVEGKVGGHNMDGLSRACQALRTQQDEQLNLDSNLKQLSGELEDMSGSYQRIMGKIQDLRNTSTDTLSLLKSMDQESRSLQDYLRVDLPKQSMALHRRVKLLQQVKGELIDGQKLADLEAKRNEYSASVLKMAPTGAAEGANDPFRQQQQMVNKIRMKKETLEQRMDRLRQKHMKLSAQLSGTGNSQAADMMAQLHGVEASIQQKNEHYTRLKDTLDFVQDEIEVVTSTAAKLKERASRAASSLAKDEKSAGISGYKDAYAKLQNLNVSKGQADSAKAETLEAVSNYVNEINSTIKAKEMELAPRVNKLRKLRKAMQELESEHAKKKVGYDAAKSKHTSRYSSLQSDVSAMVKSASTQAAKYHFVASLASITDTMVKRAVQGKKTNLFMEAINKSEESTNRLVQRQSQNANQPSGQKGLITDTLNILTAKLQCAH